MPNNSRIYVLRIIDGGNIELNFTRKHTHKKRHHIKGKGKMHHYTGTEVLYRPYGP